jgi:hypothetical protein
VAREAELAKEVAVVGGVDLRPEDLLGRCGASEMAAQFRVVGRAARNR